MTSKTPVMVLQELSVKRNLQTPEYVLVHAKQGTHENEFHYQVVIESVIAVGIGPSKQVAKHDAAQKALDELQSLGIYIPGETVVRAPRSELPSSPKNTAINCIGTLSELCLDNKIPMPSFIEISDVGPPHCKEFTYQCTITSLVTRSTAGTKKQAKQLAAKEMLDRITHVLPELVEECKNNYHAITDQDTIAADTYNQIKKMKKPKPNLSVKIEDYDLNFNSIMNEKHLTYNDLCEHFREESSEENLKALLDKLELDYAIEVLQECPPIVGLKLNTDVPFAILAACNTIELSIQDVTSAAFEYLERLTRPDSVNKRLKLI